MAARFLTGVDHLLFGDRLISKAKIFTDRATEQICVLHHHRHLCEKTFRRNAAQVFPLHSDLSLLMIPETRHQSKKRGLSAAGGAYQSGERPGRRFKARIVDHIMTFRIVE